MQRSLQSEFPLSRIFISSSFSEVKLFSPSPATKTILSGKEALHFISVYFNYINNPYLFFSLNPDKLREIPTPALVFQSKSKLPNLSKPLILGQVSNVSNNILIKKHLDNLPFYLIAGFLSILTLVQIWKLYRSRSYLEEIILATTEQDS